MDDMIGDRRVYEASQEALVMRTNHDDIDLMLVGGRADLLSWVAEAYEHLRIMQPGADPPALGAQVCRPRRRGRRLRATSDPVVA